VSTDPEAAPPGSAPEVPSADIGAAADSTGRARETLKEWLAYHGYRSLERLAMSLPERVARRVFAVMGRVAFRWLPGVRATVIANQARVLGVEPTDERAVVSAREAFELYARYWLDTFRARVLDARELNTRTIVVGVERIDRALEEGSGCLTVLPHMGNWDVAGRFLVANGYRLASVAEELRPPRLFELFLRHREELGMRIVPLTRNGHVGQQLKQLLSENWIVALVADRDLSGRGVEVEMFGATRRVPAGPALLSLTSGAPILVCPVITREDGWEIRIGPPLRVERTGDLRADVEALSRLMAASFERAIASRPSDWHLFQPGWETPRPPRRRTEAT
jgi:KDO2-lipid IV(A) lauroyltransferase